MVTDIDISSLPPEIHGDLIQQLQHSLEELIVSYASYSHGVLRCLREKHVAPADVAAYLLGLPAFVRPSDHQNLTLFSEKTAGMTKADSISQIFIILNCEWCSFLNFEIPQHLEGEFQLCLREKNMKYPEQCRIYVEMHKMSELVLVQPVLRRIIDDFRELTLLLGIEATSRVSRLLDIRKGVADILGLRHYALLYHKIRKDCKAATFLLPTSVAQFIFVSEEIFTQGQVMGFQAWLVQRMECNGYQFDFTQPTPKKMKKGILTVRIVECNV